MGRAASKTWCSEFPAAPWQLLVCTRNSAERGSAWGLGALGGTPSLCGPRMEHTSPSLVHQWPPQGRGDSCQSLRFSKQWLKDHRHVSASMKGVGHLWEPGGSDWLCLRFFQKASAQGLCRQSLEYIVAPFFLHNKTGCCLLVKSLCVFTARGSLNIEVKF